MTTREVHKKNFLLLSLQNRRRDYVRQEQRGREWEICICFFSYWGWYILQAIISIAKGIWICIADRGKQRLCKLHGTEEKRFVSHFWSLVFGIWNASCMWFAPTAVRNSKVSPDKSLAAKVRTPNFRPFPLFPFAQTSKASKGHFLKTYFWLQNPLSEWNLPGSSKSEGYVYQYTALLI